MNSEMVKYDMEFYNDIQALLDEEDFWEQEYAWLDYESATLQGRYAEQKRCPILSYCERDIMNKKNIETKCDSESVSSSLLERKKTARHEHEQGAPLIKKSCDNWCEFKYKKWLSLIG